MIDRTTTIMLAVIAVGLLANNTIVPCSGQDSPARSKMSVSVSVDSKQGESEFLSYIKSNLRLLNDVEVIDDNFALFTVHVVAIRPTDGTTAVAIATTTPGTVKVSQKTKQALWLMGKDAWVETLTSTNENLVQLAALSGSSDRIEDLCRRIVAMVDANALEKHRIEKAKEKH